jgi:uncharacterized protein YbjT (DUF2867 family)
VVDRLRLWDLPVRALVRQDDARAEALRATGAEVIVADLTKPNEVIKAVDGCQSIYFGMSVSPQYLEATMIVAAAAVRQGEIEALVNMSQMTVGEMTLASMTDSPQHKQHWLAEQALNWSGLPVVHIRPTVFLNHPFFSEWAAESINDNDTIRLPFGQGKSSPISAEDVASVITTVLGDPSAHVGQVYELTGPRSIDMNEMAKEYSEALGRTIKYVDMPFDEWQEKELNKRELPQHLADHFITMAKLHAENRYDRLTQDFLSVAGQEAKGVRNYVTHRSDLFKASAATSAS